MADFWRDSGYHLLQRTESGHLAVTDAFLSAYVRRPEMRPVEESCDAERALYTELLAKPRTAVPESRLATLADPDARDNYRILLGFRDRLVAAGTVEDCYLGTFLPRPGGPSDGNVSIPPLFIDQMTHVILRTILDGCEDGLRVRAAEMLFRAQKVTIADGAVMAADAETVDMYATSGGFGSLGQLVVEAQTPLRTVELDVLDSSNADLYWMRDEKHDTVINLNFAGDGLDALCRVLESWIAHFFDVRVSIQPVQQISDERWVWHVGLDAEASAILNDLWQGQTIDDARRAQLLSLFRLEFRDPDDMLARVRGRPVYLGLAMTGGRRLKLKPQNLLVNLPLAGPT